MILKITRENGTHYVYYLIFDNDIDHATALGIQSFILENKLIKLEKNMLYVVLCILTHHMLLECLDSIKGHIK